MKTKLILTVILTSFLLLSGCSDDTDNVTIAPPNETPPPIKTEVFSFMSNGNATKGKIYFPDSYQANGNYPTIYLLDYTEQHFRVATDETIQVIKGAQKITDLEALVVTLDAHLNIDAQPNKFRDYYEVFKNMTSYVDANYTSSTSRTFIARGSEAGVVLLVLFSEDQTSSVFNNFIATDSPPSFNNAVMDMIKNNTVPDDLVNKKLHFSFSSSNDFDNCHALIQAFEEANYPWLKFAVKEYRTDYPTTYPNSFADGLKFVFAK